MTQVVIAGNTIEVNEEGYMTKPSQWNKEIAKQIAAELNIELTPKHWEVLEYLREKQRVGEMVNIRKVGKSGIVDIKTFYKLFPGGPLKNASKIAGIPKPASYI